MQPKNGMVEIAVDCAVNEFDFENVDGRFAVAKPFAIRGTICTDCRGIREVMWLW